MAISKNDLRKCLLKKFEFQEVSGSKHEAVSFFVHGKKVATTRFSRSHRDLSDKILRLIARELWVQLSDLKEMYRCTKGPDEYVAHLKRNGYLE